MEGMQRLCNVLHMLAYVDMRQQPWQDLRASDCLHFIQLAQCGLEYLLRQAATVHSALVRLHLFVVVYVMPSSDCQSPNCIGSIAMGYVCCMWERYLHYA